MMRRGYLEALSPRWELNPRPALYERAALPLSYSGLNPTDATSRPWLQDQRLTGDFR